MQAADRRAVLVAEDNEISREVLLYQLKLLGCQAVAAEEGAAALSGGATATTGFC